VQKAVRSASKASKKKKFKKNQKRSRRLTGRECQRRRRDLVQKFIFLLGPPKDSLFIVYILYFSNFYAEGFYCQQRLFLREASALRSK
jgi:hypothetical protein